MDRQEILERINSLCKEMGLTHDQMAAAVYEARDKKLRELREQYQDKALMFYFDDGLKTITFEHGIASSVTKMVEILPDTLQSIIKEMEKKDGELGMMVNNNIPRSWATFPMGE